MPNKYNLALIPSTENISAFVAYAQNTFPIKPAEYLLGTHSIPHITLCHFEAKEEDINEIANFDPHLTLFNTKDHAASSLINHSAKANPVLSDAFHLALGRLDDIGQITEILIDLTLSP